MEKACDSCRVKKTKCNGKSPCEKCIANNYVCTYTDRNKVQDKQIQHEQVIFLETKLNLLTRALLGLSTLVKLNDVDSLDHFAHKVEFNDDSNRSIQINAILNTLQDMGMVLDDSSEQADPKDLLASSSHRISRHHQASRPVSAPNGLRPAQPAREAEYAPNMFVLQTQAGHHPEIKSHFHSPNGIHRGDRAPNENYQYGQPPLREWNPDQSFVMEPQVEPQVEFNLTRSQSYPVTSNSCPDQANSFPHSNVLRNSHINEDPSANPIQESFYDFSYPQDDHYQSLDQQ